MKFHLNLEIRNLRKIKWNDSFFFFGKKVGDFRVSMKNLSIFSLNIFYYSILYLIFKFV